MTDQRHLRLRNAWRKLIRECRLYVAMRALGFFQTQMLKVEAGPKLFVTLSNLWREFETEGRAPVVEK